MNTLTPDPALSLDDQIDLACDRFELRWDSEAPSTIEELLQEFSDTQRDFALRELLAVELELRFKRGDLLKREDYLLRLAEYSEVVIELFDSQVEQLMVTTAPVRTSGWTPALAETGTGSALKMPERIGKYRIVAALDRGGQATVYRAIHPELGRDVVIKFCHVEKSANPDAQQALRSEGRVLASLEHTNLARVYDFDFHENRAYLVMEFIRGLNLSQFRKQTSPAPEAWIPLVRQVAEALEYVHGRGILHLDIKPQNILIDETGAPRLIDFGLARTDSMWEKSGSDPEQLAGTLAFMSPEQARCEAEAIGPRSDVFGLGGVLFYLVTGKPPIVGDSAMDAWENAKTGRWNAELLNDDCHMSIRRIIESALAGKSNERIASAGELAKQLAALEQKPSWSIRAKISACLALTVGLILSLLIARQSFQSGYAVGTPTEERVTNQIKVRVWRDGNTFDLTNSAPISSTDRVEIRSHVEAGVHLSLFMFDSEGQLQLVEAVPAASQPYEYRFPQDNSKFERIVGPAGTEFVFLCGSRKRAVTLAELNGLGPFANAWPQLPEDSVIQLRSTGVNYLQRGRGFGGGVDTLDPQQQVFDTLNVLRTMLEPFSDFVDGIAFSHIE